MLAGEVQIDRGLFEITMPEENLNGAQISSRFEKMGCKAVPQGMGMNMLVLET